LKPTKSLIQCDPLDKVSLICSSAERAVAEVACEATDTKTIEGTIAY
jgi:hypothetical protein